MRRFLSGPAALAGGAKPALLILVSAALVALFSLVSGLARCRPASRMGKVG